VDEDVRRFSQLFERFMERMTDMAASHAASPVRQLIDAHLGTDSTRLAVISETFAPYDHVNVQVGLSAYLSAEGRSHELVGVVGHQRHFDSLSDLLQTGPYLRPGPVDLVNLPIGTERMLTCVQFGIYLVRDGGKSLAVLLRGPDERGPQERVTLEILTVQEEHARELLAELHRLMISRNVFRGQVCSFGEPHIGHRGLGPIVFLPRREVGRDQLVLSEGSLERIERHILGVAAQRERLRAVGQHVKRGLLLHGPPGCGKTLTVRFLIGQSSGHTVIVLTGRGLHMVRAACGLARALQPAMVVLEDVDLVADDRTMSPFGNPVLFELLNELDGIGDDADVAFVLTSNRADLLEPALAARPGRVDLAVEIGLPDEDARLRLLELYSRSLVLGLQDRGQLIARTAGVTPAFIRELIRKAALEAMTEGDPLGEVTVEDRHMSRALDELLAEKGRLTRILLGGGAEEGGGTPTRGGRDWLQPEERSG
jgi:cell division protease FtsH